MNKQEIIIRENLEDEEYTENPPIDYFAYLNEHTPLKWILDNE